MTRRKQLRSANLLNTMFPVVAALALAAMVGCNVPALTGYRTHSKTTLRRIARNPDKYAGQYYAFVGEVWDVKEVSGATMLDISVRDDTRDYDSELLTALYYDTNNNIVRGHRVRVLGMVVPEQLARPMLGSVTIRAVSVWDITAGHVYWQQSSDKLYRQWESGELFAPDSEQ